MEEQRITPYLLYKDAGAALDFLSKAFGFEETFRMSGEDGRVGHAEARLGEAAVMLGSPDGYRNPKEVGVTVLIYVMVGDVDAHYARAKAAGAEIKDEPEDQDYGHRRYSALDPEGHSWYFAAPVKAAAREEWATASAS
jgi:PhnB protein